MTLAAATVPPLIARPPSNVLLPVRVSVPLPGVNARLPDEVPPLIVRVPLPGVTARETTGLPPAITSEPAGTVLEKPTSAAGICPAKVRVPLPGV